MDLASLTPIGSLAAGTAMMIKTGAFRSVLGFAQLRPIVSGPRLAFAVPVWPAHPSVNYVHERAMLALTPLL